MTVKFLFIEPDDRQTEIVCSHLAYENAHRILTCAHFSDKGTLLITHDDGVDTFTLPMYKQVKLIEVK